MTVALTDLDRDELLALCQRRLFFVSAYDLLDAKCDVASARHKAADARLRAAMERTQAASVRLSATDIYDRPARNRAQIEFLAAMAGDRKENEKQARLWRRLEKLWAERDAAFAAHLKGAA